MGNICSRFFVFFPNLCNLVVYRLTYNYRRGIAFLVRGTSSSEFSELMVWILFIIWLISVTVSCVPIKKLLCSFVINDLLGSSITRVSFWHVMWMWESCQRVVSPEDKILCFWRAFCLICPHFSTCSLFSRSMCDQIFVCSN